MPDEPGRLPADIDFARRTAQRFTEPLLRAHVRDLPNLANELFDLIMNEVEAAYRDGAAVLTADRRQALRREVGRVIRINAFYDAVHFPNVLATQSVDQVFGLPVLVDVFRPAPEDVLGAIPYAPSPIRPEDWHAFDTWPMQVQKMVPRVSVEDRSVGAASFLTYFTDSLRAMASRLKGGTPPTVPFTVHSANNGYQLDYYERWCYAPRIFGGAKLSSPVTQIVTSGVHYCFEGRLSGGPSIRDPGTHFAGPSNTSTRTTAF